MTRYLFIIMIAALTLNTGCKLIYKQNVQQGNAHEQENLDQIKLGMSKKQVAYLLGTPAVRDPFHRDRWDYISMLSRRGGEPARRLVTLTFENDLLVATDGIGNSMGGDIRALEETKSAVADSESIARARTTEIVTDVGVINWTLQLGAYNSQEEALELAEEARQKGYETELLKQIVPGLGTRHQVRSGHYETYSEAIAALALIEKELDLAGITVPVNMPSEP